MTRVLVLALLVGLAATAAASGGTRAADACKPGTHTVGKTTYQVYCGPASASVKLGGKTHSFRNGACLRAGGTKVFAMSIGKLTISKGKPRYAYFGVSVPTANHDGIYRSAVVTWAFAGKRYSLLSVKLHLTNHQTRGSFTGRVAGKRTPASGSFRCK